MNVAWGQINEPGCDWLVVACVLAAFLLTHDQLPEDAFNMGRRLRLQCPGANKVL